MCTLTAVPLPGVRLRLAFNRDERPTRPPALPPAVRAFGDRLAVLPIDPVSGGTWLGVNDAGLALAVLNVTLPTPSPPALLPQGERGAKTSRGTIIPALLGQATPADALAELDRTFDYADFAPFRLAVVGRGVVAEVRWDGREPMVTTRLLGGAPLLFTSSGLGDHLVEGVRRELFDDLFAGPSDGWAAAQDEFHRHRWPGREHLSVNMARATARTVSYAVVDLAGESSTVTYHPAAPHESGKPTIVRLPIAPTGAS
ncbi:MAG: NRDE family protein [Gemmataceae bacterium]